jgi:transcriptional regulator GlxA family with amidase domain
LHAIGSDHRQAFDTWPGTVAFTPPGVDVFSESSSGGEYLVVRWTFEDEEDGDDRNCHERLTVTGHRQAFALALRIRRALLATQPDPYFIEQLSLRFVDLRNVRPRVLARYDRTRYNLVLERIADELDQPLRLDDLATMAGESKLAFLRGFTAAIGMTPHAYIAEQRVQAARRLIADGRMPLAEIALECGFSHQSHLGSAFKKVLGLSPGAYRLGRR